jgi:peptidoglycan/LPS O-acetylase OafA/YrhL
VAVVVGYHVDLPGFGGGFVGVDVFFVISGFLITALLLDELRQRGSIDLLAFYVRRARRLLPVFFVVVAATLLLGAFLLLPFGGEQQGLAYSTRAAALYVSNVYFAQTTRGYFDMPSDLVPLLHTWSLAVEEQFYLVGPLVLIACAWAARHRKWRVGVVIAAVLAVVFAASLTYSSLASAAGGKAARFAFFGLPSRAWELAMGAGIALALPHLRPARTWLGAALAGSGLLLIVFAVVLLHAGMPFPGVAALLPTLGAAAIIVGGWISPQSLAARLLSTPLFVRVGLLSYGWYLWHWPLLAIARARDLGVQNPSRDALIALAALGLAWLTYVWVEHPIRSRTVWRDWGKARVLGTSAASSLILIAGSGVLEGRAVYLSESERYQRFSLAADDNRRKLRCHHGPCPQGAGIPYGGLVVLWGDSHAMHFTGALHAAVAPHGFALLFRGMGGCPPVLDAVTFSGSRPSDECKRLNAEVLAEIDSTSRRGELAAVVLAGRWTAYLGRPEPSGKLAGLMLALPGQPPSAEEAPTALSRGLGATVAALTQRGIEVLVVATVPEHRYAVPKCLARKSVERCSIGRKEAERHRSLALAELKAVVGDAPGARLWDPFAALCGEEHCLAERDGIILYRDDDHLTYSGSRWLAPHFEEMATRLARARPPH